MGIDANPFAPRRFGGLDARKDELKSAVWRVEWFLLSLAPLNLQRRDGPAPCPQQEQAKAVALMEGKGLALGVRGCSLGWEGHFIPSPFAGGCFVLI